MKYIRFQTEWKSPLILEVCLILDKKNTYEHVNTINNLVHRLLISQKQM